MAGQVWRAPKDGSSPSTLIAGNQGLLGSIAVDATHVYWAAPDSGEVIAAELASGDLIVVATGQAAPKPVRVDSTHVYWGNADDGSIWRKPTCCIQQ